MEAVRLGTSVVERCTVSWDKLNELEGFRFKNCYCSCVTMGLKGQADETQNVILADMPHFQDKAQDWCTIQIDKSKFRSIYGECQRAREKECDDEEDLVFEFTLHQSSPIWHHKKIAIHDLKPIYASENTTSYGSMFATRADQGGRVGPLQNMNDQLALHLGVLEGLRLRKKFQA
uniref:Uncharacterized protein n=1 Tax=Mucochytrium quahogii TaxID=96639 RepID=A0A7S2WKA6_9STRA